MKMFFLVLFAMISSAFSFTLVGYQKGWPTKSLAINVNVSNCPSDILERLDDSFKLWNSVATSSLKLSLGSTSSTTTVAQLNGYTATDYPVVLCDTQFSANQSVDGNSVAGVGFATGTDPNGEIKYGGLILNVEAGKTGSVNAMTTTQRNIVIAHELGHMLGLGHSSSAPALMYYSVGVKQNFNLSKDDWDGISYLYPRDEIGNTSLAAGCGLVKNSAGGPSSPNLMLLLLLIPLAIYILIRFRKQAAVFTLTFFLWVPHSKAEAPKVPKLQLEYAEKLYNQGKKQEATEWAQKAADQKYADAWFWLGQHSIDPTSHYEKAAELGHPEATYRLIELFLLRANNKTNLEKLKIVRDWIKKNNTPLRDAPKTLALVDFCIEAGEVRIPKSDLPNEKQNEAAKKVKDCRQWKEGIGVEVDLTKYKHCLLSSASSDYDYVKLMEVYANGWGTEPNLKLARSLACFSSEVPAEFESLYEILSGPSLQSGSQFHFCDHVTSKMNSDLCASEQSEVNELKLRDQWGVVYVSHFSGKKEGALRLGKYEATKNRIRSLNDQLSN